MKEVDKIKTAPERTFEGGLVALAYFGFSDDVKNEARKEYPASIEKYKKEIFIPNMGNLFWKLASDKIALYSTHLFYFSKG